MIVQEVSGSEEEPEEQVDNHKPDHSVHVRQDTLVADEPGVDAGCMQPEQSKAVCKESPAASRLWAQLSGHASRHRLAAGVHNLDAIGSFRIREVSLSIFERCQRLCLVTKQASGMAHSGDSLVPVATRKRRNGAPLAAELLCEDAEDSCSLPNLEL
jgi:hypothetical protein